MLTIRMLQRYPTPNLAIRKKSNLYENSLPQNMSAALSLYNAPEVVEDQAAYVRPWIGYLHMSSVIPKSAGFIVMVDRYL